jgi:ring-1,2-phenylacetyl-CoA epoxidase subunit PaaC
MTASIALALTPPLHYVLRLADTPLIHAQRLAEWCGHGPVLEEDIALSNMALDLLGQARGLLAHAAQMAGGGLDEDTLAFLREEAQFFNLTLVEQPMRRSSAHSPGGDFADAVLRNLLVSSWLKAMWQGLLASNDETLAAIAGKAIKEARYHEQHAADWVVRLGDGTNESARRLRAALDRAWPFVGEMFQRDAVDAAAEAGGLGPARDSRRENCLEYWKLVFQSARLDLPAGALDFGPGIGSGTRGVHSEHMGYILAEMQSLQRRFPGGRW